MKRFKSAGQAQRFPSTHDQINNLFPLCREYVTATEYRVARTRAFELWTEVSGAATAAQGQQPRPIAIFAQQVDGADGILEIASDARTMVEPAPLLIES